MILAPTPETVAVTRPCSGFRVTERALGLLARAVGGRGAGVTMAPHRGRHEAFALLDTLRRAFRAGRGKWRPLPWRPCKDGPGCRFRSSWLCPWFEHIPRACVLRFGNCAPRIGRPRFCSLKDGLARRPQATPGSVMATWSREYRQRPSSSWGHRRGFSARIWIPPSKAL